MKKLFLLMIATLALGVAIVHAGDRGAGVPRSQDGTTVGTWHYAGVSASSVAFSSANANLFTGEGVVVGFIASSNTAISDYIIFRATDAVLSGATDGGNGAGDDYSTNNEFLRVYLSSITPNGISSQVSGLGTVYAFPAPIRVKRGACAKASVNTINMITYLWHKFGADTNEHP